MSFRVLIGAFSVAGSPWRQSGTQSGWWTPGLISPLSKARMRTSTGGSAILSSAIAPHATIAPCVGSTLPEKYKCAVP